MQSRNLKTLTAVLFIFLVQVVAHAQIERRVVFAKGKSSATYAGKLPRNYADYDAYVFRGKRGQTVSVRLITDDPNAFLAIYETKQELGPDEDNISAGEDEHPRAWSGKLPVTSEFSVQIYGARQIEETSKRAPYTLEITIH